MFPISMTVLGKDLRQRYLAQYMHTMGHDVICFGTMPFPFSQAGEIPVSEDLAHALSRSRLILGPIPFSRDGVRLNASNDISLSTLLELLKPGQIVVGGALPDSFCLSCRHAQIPVLDLMKDESFVRMNAALTAEGLLASLIQETPFSLQGCRLLLLGYGHCGQAIGSIFNGEHLRQRSLSSEAQKPKNSLLASVSLTVCEKDPYKLSLAKSQNFQAFTPEGLSGQTLDYDLVVNTVPARILTDSQIGRLPAHCVLFDIASAPFGFDPEACPKRLLLVQCPGIPGKSMPKTAGEATGAIILERILSYGL